LKISIVTAVFNAKKTVLAALESAFAQKHPDVELVVVDGVSTDGTMELLAARRDQLGVFISEPDKGIYHALNKGIVRASGEVIGFLHADDLFTDELVLQRIAAVFADPGVDVCYGDLVYVRRDNPDRVIRYWRAGEYRSERLRRGWMPPHPTCYVRRSLYEEHGLFDTSYRIAADYDCMLRLLSRLRGRVVYIPEVLVRMRVGGVSNRSLANILRKSAEDYRAIRANGVGGLGTLVWKNLSKLPQFIQR